MSYHNASWSDDRDTRIKELRQLRRYDPSLAFAYWLEAAGRPRKEVAEGAGLSQSSLSAILAGRQHPTPETYIRLASALGADILDFFYAEGWLTEWDVIQSLGLNDVAELLVGLQALEPTERRKIIALFRTILRVVLSGEDTE